MRSVSERTLSTLLTVAAITIAVALVRREFFTEQAASREKLDAGYKSDWRSMLQSGRTIGNPSAPISIVVFSEMQCPFCRAFHATVTRLQELHSGKIAYTFIHFPIAAHAQAFSASHAAECAHEQGEFARLVDVAFLNQSQLGIRRWSLLAQDAGVKDTALFNRCMEIESVPALISSGKALGEKLRVGGTPTVFINGWRINGAPPDSQMTRVVEDLLAGRKPYKGFPPAAVVANR